MQEVLASSCIFYLSAERKVNLPEDLFPGLLFPAEPILAPPKHQKAQEQSGNQVSFLSREYIGLITC